MRFLKSPKADAIVVTKKLLKQLNVKVSSITLHRSLTDHPDFPGLLAISDCLTEWGVENKSYQIDTAAFNKEDLLFPFIAATKTNGGAFVLVNKMENGLVYVDGAHKEPAQQTEQEFLQSWTGIALHAIANEKSGELNYGAYQFEEFLKNMMPPVAVVASGLMLAVTLNSLSTVASTTTLLSFTGVMLLKILGMGVSILLLMQSLNANNPFIKNLCSLGGKNDCNAILKSDAAKVTSWLSWSEVGFFYFAGSFLALLFVPSHGNDISTCLTLLAWLNVLALPYTIYSITYQYRNKNWCALCCMVQALLVLEVIVFLTFGSSLYFGNLTLELNTIATLAISFLLPILTWVFLKPFFKDASQIKLLKAQFKKFKYNSDLFNQALKSQPCYAVPNDLMPITKGNPHAATTITMVSNPSCGPCAQAHQTLNQLMKYRDDIQLKVIMTAAEEDTSPRKQMALHLSSLNANHDRSFVEKALHQWFGLKEKNYETWMKQFPAVLNGKEQEVLKKQKNWCDLAEVTFTPTIFINGYKLQEPYRLEDLKYLLE